MLAILKREVRNYTKNPLFWIGNILVILGVFWAVSPYLDIHYLENGEEIVNNYPEAVDEGRFMKGMYPPQKNKDGKSGKIMYVLHSFPSLE